MESTTITFAGMKLDIDYDVDGNGDVDCITDVTHEGVSIIDFCNCLSVLNLEESNETDGLEYDNLTYVLEELVQKEIDNETGPDEFAGWRVGQ